MTIEIHKRELETLIRERMKNGGFQNIEDALLDALKRSPPGGQAEPRKPKRILPSSYLSPR